MSQLRGFIIFKTMIRIPIKPTIIAHHDFTPFWPSKESLQELLTTVLGLDAVLRCSQDEEPSGRARTWESSKKYGKSNENIVQQELSIISI